MKTFDTTPTSDFLEAYRRVTGGDDISAGVILAAMLDGQTADEIRREHAEIKREKEDQRPLTKYDEREQFKDDGFDGVPF